VNAFIGLAFIGLAFIRLASFLLICVSTGQSTPDTTTHTLHMVRGSRFWSEDKGSGPKIRVLVLGFYVPVAAEWAERGCGSGNGV